MTIVQEILEIFEDYLEEKGVEINNPERAESDTAAQLYGTEYGDLENKITNLITTYPCDVEAGWRVFDGDLIRIKRGKLEIKSDALMGYIDNYSME